jgi:pimeloyl-[acyl-carrier protein] methyl ester esterase
MIHIKSHGHGFPVVFFHGWGFDSSIWTPLVPQLKRFYQLILVDLPGFGMTPMMDWCEFKEQLSNLLPKRFALVGWSMGGLYATRFASELPERVSLLFNVATSPYFLADALWPGLSTEVFMSFNNKLAHHPSETLDEFVQLQLNRATLVLPSRKTPSIQALQSGLNILESWDLRSALAHIDIPICFLFGRLDIIVSARTMRTMQGHYPKFNYILFQQAAHIPFLSHTEEFIDKIKEYIL